MIGVIGVIILALVAALVWHLRRRVTASYEVMRRLERAMDETLPREWNDEPGTG